ncbi:transmembrane protein [Cystoisospora suis]|uniref:Transmembrane protein n=1 Tax=Cystoisospora suis TaxID=483139 RepID=A0A2C6LH49_9APIC|nr:transmembrane protein [Cystoisospora suis]
MEGPFRSPRAGRLEGPMGHSQLPDPPAPVFPGCSLRQGANCLEAAPDGESPRRLSRPQKALDVEVIPFPKGEKNTRDQPAAAAEAVSVPESFKQRVNAHVFPAAYVLESPVPFPDAPPAYGTTDRTPSPRGHGREPKKETDSASSRTDWNNRSLSSSEGISQRGKPRENEAAPNGKEPSPTSEIQALTGEEREAGRVLPATRLPEEKGQGHQSGSWLTTSHPRTRRATAEEGEGGSTPEKDVNSSGGDHPIALEKQPQLSARHLDQSARAGPALSQSKDQAVGQNGEGLRPRQKAGLKQPYSVEAQQLKVLRQFGERPEAQVLTAARDRAHRLSSSPSDGGQGREFSRHLSRKLHPSLQGHSARVSGKEPRESRSLWTSTTGVRGGVREWCRRRASWFLEVVQSLPKVPVGESAHRVCAGPLRFDRPDGIPEEAPALNSCCRNAFFKGSAGSRTQASYIRPYAAAMAAASGLCAVGGLVHLFLGVFLSFPSASDSTSFSFVPPPRALALSCFLWAAFVSALAAAAIPALLFISSLSDLRRSSSFLGNGSSTDSSSPSSVPHLRSGFSLENPFAVVYAGKDQKSAGPTPKLQESQTGDNRARLREHVSSPTSFECLQNARDALFGAAFLRIYAMCSRGDLAGAKDTASSCAEVDAWCNWGEEGTEEGIVYTQETPSASSGPEMEDAVRWNATMEIPHPSQTPHCRRTNAASACSHSSSGTSLELLHDGTLSDKRAPLVVAERRMKVTIFRATRLIGCMSFFATIGRLLLLSAAIAWGRGNGDEKSTATAHADGVALPFSYLSFSTSSAPSPVHLDRLCSWLALDVVPLLAIVHYGAVALLVRPRKESGILERQGIVICLIFGLSAAAEVFFFPGSCGRFAVFWRTATSAGLKVCLVLLLWGQQLFDSAMQQYSLQGRSQMLSSLTAGAAGDSLILASTARTAAAAATLWALAVKRHNRHVRQRERDPSGSSCTPRPGLVSPSARAERGPALQQAIRNQAIDVYREKQRELARLHTGI